MLAEIMAFQGVRLPIVVSKRSGFMTHGHGRLLAAKLNGWTEFPVDDQAYANEAEEYADLISDNAIAELAEADPLQIQKLALKLGPDFDLNLLGIPEFKIIQPDTSAPGTSGEDSGGGDLPPVPRTIKGDIYLLGEHRLMCGDSTMLDDVEKLMAGEKADMVYTDPPYGMSVVKKQGMVHGIGIKGACESGVYRPVVGDDSTRTAIDAYNLCASLGIQVMVFWGANFYAEVLPPSSGWICWDKENGEDFFADGELAWTNADRQLRIVRHQWKGMIKASERGEKRIHPTQKPSAVAEWTFEKYGKDCHTVLDLFGGSGSTLIACEKTKRKCRMMEIDPRYCDVILNRWAKFTGQTPHRIGEGGELIPWHTEESA